MSFTPWVPSMGGSSLAIAMNEGRRNHTLSFVDINGNTWPIQVQPGYESQTYYYTAAESIYAGESDQSSATISLPYAPMVAIAPFTVSLPLNGTIVDSTANESYAYSASDFQSVIDLSRWEVHACVHLQISATRAGHVLEVHSDEGEIFPVEERRFQNSWSYLTAFDLPAFTASWSFFEVSKMPPNRNWWVYDRSTDEYSPSKTTDLISWLAADRDVDTDGDLLPDWFERTV